MLARQSGTRCQMNLKILTALTVLNGFWKRFCSVATSVTSALEVSFNEMRYINLPFIDLRTPRLARSLLFLSLTLSVCPFVCHKHCFFFFCFSMVSSHSLDISSPWQKLQNVVLRFWICCHGNVIWAIFAKKSNCFFFFLFLDGIERFLSRHFIMTPSTKLCSYIFYLGPLTPKIYSPKFAQNRL